MRRMPLTCRYGGTPTCNRRTTMTLHAPRNSVDESGSFSQPFDPTRSDSPHFAHSRFIQPERKHRCFVASQNPPSQRPS